MHLIDGYNLLWSTYKDDSDAHEITEAQMCKLLHNVLAALNDKGAIIFDGIGPPDKTGLAGTSCLEVIFSGTRTDADTIIENLISTNTAPRSLIVVSSDRRLRDAAKARRAVSVKSEQFWSNQVSRLGQPQKQVEPQEKQAGLDEGQTKHWLEYFGIEQ